MSELIVTNLTEAEQTFCLAVIEYGGNLAAAYRAAFGNAGPGMIARAHELISRPEIATRIKQLHAVVDEHAYFSLGSHMAELANIRDLAKAVNDFKTALIAEQTRGQVMGFYGVKQPAGGKTPQTDRPAVIINIGSSPGNVTEWAAKHGHTPIVIEAG
jgi:hypothetical protein